MALQFVGGNSAIKAGATSGNSTVSLTALTGGISSSAAIGDIVIAVFATGSTTDRTLSITDGTNNYTLINSELYSNGSISDTNLRVAYKILTAADSSVTFGPTLNAADAGTMAVYVWRGIDALNPLDVAAVPATGTGTGRPNPAAITPSTAGSKIILVGASAQSTGAIFTASYLTSFITVTSPDTYDSTLGIGYADWTSGAYDGAQWGGGTTGSGDSWAAISIAIRPAPTRTLTPGLFTNNQTFYAPTVVLGGAPQALSANLYTNSNTFYSATAAIDGEPQTLTGVGDLSVISDWYLYFFAELNIYNNPNVFYTAEITADQDLVAEIYTNTQEFYAGEINTQNDISVDLFINNNAIYDATVEVGSVNVSADLFTNESVYYAAEVTQGNATQNIVVDLFENKNNVYESIISLELSADIYNNTSSIYEPLVATSNNVDSPYYENENSFYLATVTQIGPEQSLEPNLFENSNQYFASVVQLGAAPQSLTAELFSNTNQYYSATVAIDGEPQTLAPNRVDNQNAYFGGNVAIDGEPQYIIAGRYDNQPVFFEANVTIDGAYQELVVSRLNNTSNIYEATINTIYNIEANRFNNTGAFFRPRVFEPYDEFAVRAGSKNLSTAERQNVATSNRQDATSSSTRTNRATSVRRSNLSRARR